MPRSRATAVSDRPKRTSSLPNLLESPAEAEPSPRTRPSCARSSHQHGIEFTDFELAPPLPPRSHSQVQAPAPPLPKTNISSPQVPSRSILRYLPHDNTHDSNASVNTMKTTRPDPLSESDIAILSSHQSYLNIPDLVPVSMPNTVAGSMQVGTEMRDMPAEYYKPGAGRERRGSEGKDPEQSEVEEGKTRGRRCCGCTWTRKRVMIILRVLSCLFAITLLICIFFVPVDDGLCWAGICVASIYLLFNFSILTTQCCKSHERPSTKHKNVPKTFNYALVALDFLFAIALMVMGMVGLIKGIVFSHDWQKYDGWPYEVESLHMMGIYSGIPEEFMGTMFLVAGLVEGASWGVGAAGIWR